MLANVSFEHGVHLRGTPLWFDADRKRPLCVATSLAAGLPPKHDRLVLSSPMAEALTRAGFKGEFLPAPFERWIGLGGQEVRLVEAPGALGAAYVEVASGTERYLVTGLMRKQVIHWPQADVLVATVPALQHRGATLERVLKGLELFLDQAAVDKIHVLVVVGSVEVALLVHQALASRGRKLRLVGLARKLAPAADTAGKGAALGVWDARPPAGARVAWVDCGIVSLKQADRGGRSPDATFRLAWYADWVALKHAVTVCGARAVALVAAPQAAKAVAGTKLGPGVALRWLGSARQLSLD
ncbi:MAG: hypothetical protein HY903_24125 [Deltaproteobacteria bacterium]|nr:hypothetical protein [Deltaproteobacteria bacterium]